MWYQNYVPVGGSLAWSALTASLPLVIILGLLLVRKTSALRAVLAGLTVTMVVATLIYQMPASFALLSALYGFAYGLFPIGWIVVTALFVYDLSVATGTFEHVRKSITSGSSDKRIQVLLIAFCFGSFLEGASGFGTPVAIVAAMLIGLGFAPTKAASLALLGNTAPVAFAALGTPIIVLSSVTGLPLNELSAVTGRLLLFLALVVPFTLVWTLEGWKGIRDVWPSCLVAGGSFGLVQVLLSTWHGPWIVGIASGIASILALVLFVRMTHSSNNGATSSTLARPVTPGFWRAWIPWITLSVVVFLWGIPIIQQQLSAMEGSSSQYSVPLLDLAVVKTSPLVVTPQPEPARLTLNWLSATGTALLVSGIISALALGVRPGETARIFVGTFLRLRTSLLTIAGTLAVASVIRYAGMDATLGLALAGSGQLYPFFSPILGWIGTAITGSDTSSNVLFGNVQRITAQSLGMSAVLAAAANGAGGVIGKMISTQSIVVACAATGQSGNEGAILGTVFRLSAILIVLMGFIVLACAYL